MVGIDSKIAAIRAVRSWWLTPRSPMHSAPTSRVRPREEARVQRREHPHPHVVAAVDRLAAGHGQQLRCRHLVVAQDAGRLVRPDDGGSGVRPIVSAPSMWS